MGVMSALAAPAGARHLAGRRWPLPAAWAWIPTVITDEAAGAMGAEGLLFSLSTGGAPPD